MKTMKECPCECGRRCSVEFLMCRYCWTMVPKVIKEGVYATPSWAPEGQELRQAATEASVKRRRVLNIARIAKERKQHEGQ